MNKDQFLKRLSELLDRLSPEERRDAIRYYVEYFDEAGPENETRILLELGSPEEAAAAILADHGYDMPGAESAESTAKPSAAEAVRGAGQKAGGCLKKIFSLFKRAFLFCLKLALAALPLFVRSWPAGLSSFVWPFYWRPVSAASCFPWRALWPALCFCLPTWRPGLSAWARRLCWARSALWWPCSAGSCFCWPGAAAKSFTAN